MNEEERTEARGDYADWSGPAPRGRPATVALSDLAPDPNVPARFLCTESIEAARAEIESDGLLRPLLVRPSDESGARYWVFAGARMLEALKANGVEQVQVQIFDVDGPDALWLASSVQHVCEDWSPIRKARAVGRLATNADGTINDEAVTRCRSLFAKSTNPPLTRRRILQMRQVGRAFSEEEADRLGVSFADLASISHRRLIEMSRQEDPWDALTSGPEADETPQPSPERNIEVRRGRNGNRNLRIAPEPPEEWSPEEVELFRNEIGPIWNAIVAEGNDSDLTEPVGGSMEDAGPDRRKDGAGVDAAELQAERDRLLRQAARLGEQAARLGEELAAARSVIAALHAARAVSERRRAESLEVTTIARTGSRWTGGFKGWIRNAFRASAKRVSVD